MSLRRHVARFGGFFGIQLAGMLAPFLALPVLSRLAGANGWVAIGIGQSAGAIAATVILFGWALHGPARLAKATNQRGQLDLLAESLQSRSIIAILAIPAVAVFAYVASSGTGYEIQAAFIATAGAAAGFSSGWYAVGLGRPGYLATFDLLPKLIGTATGLALLAATRSIDAYAICVGIAPVVSVVVLSARSGLRRENLASIASVLRGLSSQSPLAGVNILGALYSSAPVILAGTLLAAPVASGLVSADKIYRFALFTVVAMANSLQSWVLTSQGPDPRRLRASFAAHTTLGLVGAAAILVAGPAATAFLFGAAVEAGFWTSAGYAIAFLACSVGTPLIRNALVPSGATGAPLVATLTAGVSGVAAMLIFTIVLGLGAAGVAWGYALSEIVSTAVLVLAWRKFGSRPTNSGD